MLYTNFIGSKIVYPRICVDSFFKTSKVKNNEINYKLET